MERTTVSRKVGAIALALTLSIASAVGVVVATATPAFAPTLGRSPFVEAAPNTAQSMSCPTNNFCMIVSGNGQYQTLVDRVWSDANTVTGAGAFTGVSCTSGTSCLAVDDKGRAFTFNSGAWSAPRIIDLKAGLAAVSC